MGVQTHVPDTWYTALAVGKAGCWSERTDTVGPDRVAVQTLTRPNHLHKGVNTLTARPHACYT